MARRAGLETGTIDATKTVHDHVSQGNVTDWDFLTGLAREVGFHVGVIDGKFDFRKPVQAATGPQDGTYTSQDPLQLVMGKDLLRFRAIVRSSEQVEEVQVRGWDMRQKRAVVGIAPAATASATIGTTPKELAGTLRRAVLRRGRRALSTSRARWTRRRWPWPRTSPAPSPSSKAWPGATPTSGPGGR